MSKLTKKEKTTITKLRLDKDSWWMVIHCSGDGYIVETNDGLVFPIVNEDGQLATNEEMLWEIIDYFNMNSSRFEREQISIIKEVGDKYFLQPGETIEKKYYEVVKKIEGSSISAKKPECAQEAV